MFRETSFCSILEPILQKLPQQLANIKQQYQAELVNKLDNQRQAVSKQIHDSSRVANSV